jgi:hypothetical protein
MAANKLSLPPLLESALNLPNTTQITYWQKSLSGYKCHLFVCSQRSEEELNLHWEKITSTIALQFQANLKEPIQIWNIYLVFFVTENVSKNLKYKIEQDKYCCRKIIEDNVEVSQTDEAVIAYLEQRIFSMKSIEASHSTTLSQTTKNIIENYDGRIIEVLKDFQSSNNKFEKFYSHYKQLRDGSQQS